MNTIRILVVLMLLVALTASHPDPEALAEAARGGARIRVTPIRGNRNSRKSKAKKRQPKVIHQIPSYYYRPYYQSHYQPPYDPTGHGDPQFSFFQGR